jgi:hypothetical protein
MGLTVAAFNVQLRLLIRKAGLSFEELQPDHVLRKSFDTTLINSNIDSKFKEMLMGHSIKLDDVYYDTKNEVSSNKLRLEYMKASMVSRMPHIHTNIVIFTVVDSTNNRYGCLEISVDNSGTTILPTPTPMTSPDMFDDLRIHYSSKLTIEVMI